MMSSTNFSAVVTDVQRTEGDATCLTVTLTGHGRPWFGDQLELRAGARPVGRFRVAGLAVQISAADGRTVMRLISADAPARTARPGHTVSICPTPAAR